MAVRHNGKQVSNSPNQGTDSIKVSRVENFNTSGKSELGLAGVDHRRVTAGSSGGYNSRFLIGLKGICVRSGREVSANQRDMWPVPGSFTETL